MVTTLFILFLLSIITTIIILTVFIYIVIKNSKNRPKISKLFEISFQKDRILQPKMWENRLQTTKRKLTRRYHTMNGDEIIIYEFSDKSAGELRRTKNGKIIYFKAIYKKNELESHESRKEETGEKIVEVTISKETGTSRQKTETEIDTLINKEINVSLS